MAEPEIHIYKDRESLSEAAAELFVELAGQAAGKFTVALSGGSTPKELYRLLASDKFRNKIDWTKLLFLIGDERDAPPDSPDSNYRMASETLFGPLNISNQQVLRWETEHNDPQIIAREFERRLARFAAKDQPSATAGGTDSLPRIDLILLGLGADAHTASLFPHTDALHETERTAVANWVEKLDTLRFTLTFPVINNAANVVFLAAGADKAEAVQNVIEGNRNTDEFPAQSVDPKNGRLIWLLDEAAARLLTKSRS